MSGFWFLTRNWNAAFFLLTTTSMLPAFLVLLSLWARCWYTHICCMVDFNLSWIFLFILHSHREYLTCELFLGSLNWKGLGGIASSKEVSPDTHNTVDPWTTLIWTEQGYSYVDYFQSVHSTVLLQGWIHRCGTYG